MRGHSHDNQTRTNQMKTMGGAMAIGQSSGLTRLRQGMLVAVLAFTAGLCMLAAASVAKAAPYGLETAAVSLSTTQAGAHPDLKLDFKLTKNETTNKPEFGTKTVVTDLPPGLVGNPTNYATCDMANVIRMTITSEAETREGNLRACPRSAAVGYMDATVRYGYTALGFTLRQRVYRLPSDPGEPAAFGTSVVNQPIRMTVGVRSDGDYGLQVTASKLPEPTLTEAVSVVFWGVPADRQGGGEPALLWDGNPILQTKPTYAENAFGYPLNGTPRTPLLTNPTSCPGEELSVGLDIASWADPGTFHSASPKSPAITGCEKVDFKPTISVSADSSRAGEPSGLTVDVNVPQTNHADQLATSHLKDAVVTMPKGVTLSTALAEGLTGCTDAQFAIGSKAEDNCPPASKIGTVQLDTPLLEAPMKGAIYAGSQESSDPKSGQMYRIFTTAEGSGVRIKLEGKIEVDPLTGQITTKFTDNPQLPFTNFSLRFKGGDRAPLVLPQACGEYRTVAQFTGHSAPTAPVETWSSFKVDQNCASAGQFTPGFEAGTANPVGGQYSPFTLRVTRPAGQQNIAALATTLPEGLLAKLGGVPLCGEAEAATGNCPPASQVGAITVAAGEGNSPLMVPQPGKEPTGLYLAGPYKGGPYSLVAKVPAQAGPFDLGTVAVRNSIKVNPINTQVAVQSDPLPQILKGIPVSYRDLRVEVNRPGFTINPTSCDAASVGGTIASANGALVPVSDRFQVADCGNLGFKPKLAMRFFGKTNRSAHPRLKATLSAAPGEANIGKAVVLMPKTELLENAHIRTICTRDQWAADACPEGAIYGYAKAWSPLLDQPLQGPVYLRANGGARELPDLVADLKGQIDVELVGYIDAVNARLRARFVSVPDAPVSKFVLNMKGGKKSLLVHNTNVCKTKPRASVKLDGQNGKHHDFNPVVKTSCNGKAKKANGAKKRVK
jgi:hypothetical protein